MNTKNTRGIGNGSTTGLFQKALSDNDKAAKKAAQLAALAKKNAELGIDAPAFEA